MLQLGWKSEEWTYLQHQHFGITLIVINSIYYKFRSVFILDRRTDITDAGTTCCISSQLPSKETMESRRQGTVVVEFPFLGLPFDIFEYLVVVVIDKNLLWSSVIAWTSVFNCRYVVEAYICRGILNRPLSPHKITNHPSPLIITW